MMTYIAIAKQYEPIVTKEVHEFIAEKYVSKRMEQSNKLMEGYTYTTPRTLLAIIRLSQSLVLNESSIS
jgi:DNA replication licensing factor MCM7